MNEMGCIILAWAYHYLLILCYGLVEDNSFLRVAKRGFLGKYNWFWKLFKRQNVKTTHHIAMNL